MATRFILTDVDDTVLEFAKCFQDWAIARGHVADGHIRERGCIGTVLGLEDEPTWNLIDDFYRDPAFAEITPEPCALEVLPRLRRAGYDFVAISACADDEETVAKRRKNLEEVFGFRWHSVYCTGVRLPKDKFLQSFEPTFWVEDNFHHAVRGSEIGHQSLLLDRDYNRSLDHPKVTRVSDWHAIAEMLTG